MLRLVELASAIIVAKIEGVSVRQSLLWAMGRVTMQIFFSRAGDGPFELM